jgi:hypothetical protein
MTIILLAKESGYFQWIDIKLKIAVFYLGKHATAQYIDKNVNHCSITLECV